jgi:glycerophosphoryl diester phosphodiesterase
VPFLLHDATLERTTNSTGTAGDLPWSDLSQRDAGGWHSHGFAGEPMPTLAAIAAFIQRNGFALNIEIKPTPGVEEHTGRVVADHAQRLWADQPVPPLLSSFQPEALKGARETAPFLPRALLLDSLWTGWFEMVAALDCVAVVANHKLMDAELIARLHAGGLRALVYTVNDADAAQRLQSIGIDGIITDAVDRFSPAAG